MTISEAATAHDPAFQEPEARDGRGTQLTALVTRDDTLRKSVGDFLTRRGFGVIATANREELSDRMRGSQPDLFIVDSALADPSAAELCRWLRKDPSVPANTPILAAHAGTLSQCDRLELLRAGAWDCLSLPADSEELILKLSVFTQSKSDADFTKATSLLDANTDLYNVRGLMRRAREQGATADRYRRALACVVFAPALSRGATVGTESKNGDGSGASALIRALLHTFEEVCRVSDVVGRLSETEFAVLAPETSPTRALQMTQRILSDTDAELRGAGAHGGVEVCAGYWAVSDFHLAGVSPVETVVRAMTALRELQRNRGADERIRFYFPDPAADRLGR